MLKLVLVVLIYSTAVVSSSFAQNENLVGRVTSPQESALIRSDLGELAEKRMIFSTHIAGSNDMAFNRQIGIFLREKAKKPDMPVQALIDGWESKKNLTRAEAEALDYLGIETYIFRPKEGIHLLKINNRMHDKIYAVDGGAKGLWFLNEDRNMTKDYFGISNKSFVSEGSVIKGPATKEVFAHFDKMIADPAVERIRFRGKMTPQIKEAVKRFKRFAKKPLPQRFFTGIENWKEKMRVNPEVTFMGDDINLKGKIFGTAQKTHQVMGEAEDFLFIKNAYVDLTEEDKKAILQAKKNGTKNIIVVTSMDKANDMKLVGAAWPRSRKWLASHGVTVYEHIGANEEYKAAALREKELELAKKLTSGDPKYKNSFSNPDKMKLKDPDNRIHAEVAVHKKTILTEKERVDGSLNKDHRSTFTNTETITTYKVEDPKGEFDRAMQELQNGKYVKTVDKGKIIYLPESYGRCRRILAWALHRLI